MPADPDPSAPADAVEGAGADRAFALVGDLVARERRDRRPALHVAALDRTASYRDLCTTAYKAGNVLSHLGVRAGDPVDVSPRPLPQPLFTFLGAALLGAVTRFDAEPGTDARAVVVPVERESGFDLPGGSKLVAFDGEPERPATTRWETEVWSENPAFPPTFHDPADPVIRGAIDGDDGGDGDECGDSDGDTSSDGDGDGGGDGVEGAERTYSHADLLGAAAAAVDALGLDADSRVAVRAPLSDPRAVAAGVLAPLAAGGTVVFPDGDERPTGEAGGGEAAAAVVAAGRAAPEGRALALEDVAL